MPATGRFYQGKLIHCGFGARAVNPQHVEILKNRNRFDKNENRYRKQVANAWGQNFQADFKSGYFADVIGFDASYYGGIKLGQVKTSPPVQFYIMMMAMRKGTTKLVNVMQK